MEQGVKESPRYALSRRQFAFGLGAAAPVAAPILASGLWAGPASAQSGMLAGKVVRILVGAGQGGGYDLYARMLAPYFEKATNATVVIENRPGGNNLIALNQLVRSKPDGLTMMMLAGEAAIFGQFTKQPGIAYDLNSTTVLARATDEVRVVLVRSDFPHPSLQAAAAAGMRVIFPSQGRLDTLGDYASTTCEALSLGCRLVTGYAGSREAALAVMGGEADAIILSEGSAKNYVDSGKVKAISTIHRQRAGNFPDVPTIFEQGTLSSDKAWWIDFRNSITEYGRIIVAPPHLPRDVLDYLRATWRSILTDEALLEEAKKLQRPLNYGDPQKMEEIVKTLLLSFPENRADEVREVLLRKFG